MWKPAVEYREHAGEFLARSPFEKGSFSVKWNNEWGTWALTKNQNVLVAVGEVWIEGNK